ncbi:MAG TPA: S-layer homology domain-containing protein [Candidatus Obscuribacterales bacterium]
MSKWMLFLIGFLLLVDSFFVSYAIGLNMRKVKVVQTHPAPQATAVETAQEATAVQTGSESQEKTQLAASTPAAGSTTFTDLTQTESRLQSSLIKAADAGILDPTTDKQFRPNDPVTRADFTRWMARIRQIPAFTPETATYADVPPSNPYYAEIEGATKAMMVQGYNVKGSPQKEFKPDNNITRQEFAVMYGTFSGKRGRAEMLSKDDIEKYLRYNAATSQFQDVTFRDVGDIDDWARKWVAVANQAGVLEQCFDVSPYAASEEKRYLHPQQMMTRAEAVNILVRLYGAHSKSAVQ